MKSSIKISLSFCFLFFLIFSFSSFIFSQDQDIYNLVETKKPLGSFVGVFFQDINNGNILVSYNEHVLFTPASVTKILSTLVAWEVLGPDFRYTTTVYVPRGNLSPVLNGDIVIKSNGDPSMNVDTLKENLRNFILEGVKEISGNIVIDNSLFSDERWGRGWEWDYKNPSVDAVILREYVNSFDPNDRNAVALNFGQNVKKILESFGIKVTGNVKVGRVPTNYREFVVIKSPPLKNLISIANKTSSNSYAEQILRTVGLRVYKFGNINNSLRVINDFYKKLFGEFYPFRLSDGCGLSTYNLLTPYMISQTLAYAFKNHGGFEGFISTLSLSGKDGTLVNRLKDVTVYGKTGTLQGVSNIAGILVTKTGRIVAFCIMVNNFTIPSYAVMEYQDQIIRYVRNNY